MSMEVAGNDFSALAQEGSLGMASGYFAGGITNPSGIIPTGFNVLIKPEKVEEKIGSIFIPEKERDRMQFATTRGTIVAVSPVAFTYVEREQWDNAGSGPPKPGDAVVYKRYSGVEAKGNDGETYFLVEDREVYATIT